jgi:hypothetical protein
MIVRTPLGPATKIAKGPPVDRRGRTTRQRPGRSICGTGGTSSRAAAAGAHRRRQQNNRQPRVPPAANCVAQTLRHSVSVSGAWTGAPRGRSSSSLPCAGTGGCGPPRLRGRPPLPRGHQGIEACSDRVPPCCRWRRVSLNLTGRRGQRVHLPRAKLFSI